MIFFDNIKYADETIFGFSFIDDKIKIECSLVKEDGRIPRKENHESTMVHSTVGAG